MSIMKFLIKKKKFLLSVGFGFAAWLAKNDEEIAGRARNDKRLKGNGELAAKPPILPLLLFLRKRPSFRDCN